LCLLESEEVCHEIIPHDGDFVFRVGGHEIFPGSTKWDFCGVKGDIGFELHFKMVHGVCKPGALFYYEDYCDGYVSLGYFVGSLLVEGVHSTALTAYDTSMLQHIVAASTGLPSTSVTVTSTSHSHEDLVVNFMLSAVMEELNFNGAYTDMAEAFTSSIAATLENSATEGYLLTMMMDELHKNVLNEKDILESASSIKLVSLQLHHIDYKSLATNEVFASVDEGLVENSMDLTNEDGSSSSKNAFFHSLEHGIVGMASIIM